MAAILVLLITFALGYGAYRIIRNGFRYPQWSPTTGTREETDDPLHADRQGQIFRSTLTY
jgi:hypothetical protein